ncbi:hypothetical protein SAMN04515671_4395 [Nakamurella panacisegetis]|uniref:Nitroimidazol reductase NimA, pyridoxamine 5'-phosphate oxidase superfamily n=1 Tax=Nakamurella panacisegetis TaxID=1090615 RepID=A0A1H0T0F4_9ACTN|nr:pyridoxamine 5'-phosphate oxidase family protein [Nakamurella panacisegetis]SDP47523.1 hypothetical protein SAMN04515671_4395 [Nakamurella panacisegetis]
MSSVELTRMKHKAVTDRAALDVLLDEVHLGHFALIVGEYPVVLPIAVARDRDVVLAHGSTGSPWLRTLASGVETSLAVTALDGLQVARTAFESGMNYRSAVLFGRCTVIAETAAKRRALDVLTDALIPGRLAEVRASTAKEMASTLVLALPIEKWSLKVTDGWPEDSAVDMAGDAWAGVVPLSPRYGEPVASPDLRPGVPVPASVLGLSTGPGDHRA